MELSLRHAREQQLSVERVADHMGLPSHWTLYRWLENGRLPAILIRNFEHATGCTFVSEYIASAAHKLLVPIPSGRPVADSQLINLQHRAAEAVKRLSDFYRGEAEADATLSALTDVMIDLAGHIENVTKAQAPELELEAAD
jgi:hypothetical protein